MQEVHGYAQKAAHCPDKLEKRNRYIVKYKTRQVQVVLVIPALSWLQQKLQAG